MQNFAFILCVLLHPSNRPENPAHFVNKYEEYSKFCLTGKSIVNPSKNGEVYIEIGGMP